MFKIKTSTTMRNPHRLCFWMAYAIMIIAAGVMFAFILNMASSLSPIHSTRFFLVEQQPTVREWPVSTYWFSSSLQNISPVLCGLSYSICNNDHHMCVVTTTVEQHSDVLLVDLEHSSSGVRRRSAILFEATASMYNYGDDGSTAIDLPRVGNIVTMQSAAVAVVSYVHLYHSWAEGVPKLLALLTELPDSVRVITNFAFNSGIDTFLVRLFGTKVLARLVRFEHGAFESAGQRIANLHNGIRVNTAFVVRDRRSSSCSYKVALENDSYMLRTFLSMAGYTTSVENRLLFVQRSESERRKIREGDAIYSALSKSLPPGWSHTMFVGSDHTIEESFREFSRAKIVVAAHGAALTFAHAMFPNQQLIELTYPGAEYRVYDYYRILASKLGVDYTLVLCSGTHETEMSCEQDAVVDAVREALARL